ncbi:MAG: hypothetical protein ACRC80_09170, partial [Waterburya sp.]
SEKLITYSLPSKDKAFDTHIPDKHVEKVVILMTDSDTLDSTEYFRLFKNSQALFLPLYAFGSDSKTAIYSINSLRHSDFIASTKLNGDFLEFLASVDKPIVLKGHGTDITYELNGKVDLMYAKRDIQLQPGIIEPIASYCEVAMVPNAEDFFHPGYVVNGEFCAAGIAVARHSHMPAFVREQHKKAWELFDKLQQSGKFPIKLIIENSRVVKILAGEDNLIEEVRQLTNPLFDGMLIEVAFSTNTGMSPDLIDWRFNSVLNESSLGVHIAMGDGGTGAHIDFIAPGVEVQ